MSLPVSDLKQLLQCMEPILNEGAFVFASLPLDADVSPLQPLATIREPEGLSVVVTGATAQRYQLTPLFEAAWITLRVHSDLHAVGLTAAFAGALGAAGISCNVVAGAYHDHLFVPVDRAQDAMTTLRALQHPSD
ncbi:ACT domain-containing protein [Geothrix alkalitolerans]|uniref:ACT domain-containing protein n=1 Tax=Geothrix alkalitolerans TaxID=2922724 RepID=UPI001FAF45F1|nr:ACT domain-containing protein [Geothrix alkalitolerans]